METDELVLDDTPVDQDGDISNLDLLEAIQMMAQAEEGETVEVVDYTTDAWLQVPFSEYSVSEGLLLCVLLMLFFGACWSIIRRCIYG